MRRAETALPKKTRRAWTWTHFGLWAERITHAFWPFWSVLFVGAALALLGAFERWSVEAVWVALMALILGAGYALWYAGRHFRRPSRVEALARLDASLPGRPITALLDTQAIGAGDGPSEALWQAHLARMSDKAALAKGQPGDLRVSRRDPYGLRYMAVLALMSALLFGSLGRLTELPNVAPGQAIAAGPVWEGWVSPPAYTGKPTLYLNDVPQGAFRVPQGSNVALRLYGEDGALSVRETISGKPVAVEADPRMSQSFDVSQSGTLIIEGEGGATWDIAMIPDAVPEIEVTGAVSATAMGEMEQPFAVRDDFAVVAGRAVIARDVGRVTRRFGLEAEPEPREAILIDLPLSLTGDRAAFEEVLREDFSEHPFANLPVTMTLYAVDDLGQEGASDPVEITLPGLRFFEPLAAAIIEMRRDLLWTRENAARVAQVMRAVSHKPDDLFRKETTYLRYRVILRRLESFAEYGMSTAQQEEIAAALWDLAYELEFGGLADALERLQRAQERLSEAMREGASEAEIAELMQELRDAERDYIRQLAQQQDREAEQNGEQSASNGTQIMGDQLEQMRQEIQRLMEEGRMAEAQQLMEQYNELMQNLQVQQAQNGQGQGNQSMQGLADTLREQRELSDESFQELQEQVNPGQQGQQQGQQGQEGQQEGQQQGQQGQQPGDQSGQQQGGQQGQAQNGQGQQPGSGQQPGQQPGQQSGQGNTSEGLAERQQQLRNELDRQRSQLPGAGTAEGDAARDALGRAGRAMDDAEDSLRQDDLAGAIDNQSRAIEALRDGMRALGEALAQQQQQGQGQQQGNQMGQANPQQRDPLGRDMGGSGRLGTQENLLQGEDVYRRARDLLDEIRRRSGDGERPDVELEYLKRLLERF